MLLKGNVTKFEFATAYTSTNYGISRYESTPFIINIALFGCLDLVNEDLLAMDLIRVPDRWGYFNMKDLLLDYYDNYFAVGITPEFKKYNASDWETQNNTWDFNNSHHSNDTKKKLSDVFNPNSIPNTHHHQIDRRMTLKNVVNKVVERMLEKAMSGV